MSLACYVTAVTLQPGAELPATDVVLDTKNPAIAELDRLFTEKGLIPAHYAIWKDEPAAASLQALGEFIPRAKEALNQKQKLYFSSWY